MLAVSTENSWTASGKGERQIGIHEVVHVLAAVQREAHVVVPGAVDRKLFAAARANIAADVAIVAGECGHARRKQRQIGGVAPIQG